MTDYLNSFPFNAMILLGKSIKPAVSNFGIFFRPLRPTDPNNSIGIFGTLWQPNDESFEIGHVVHEPTLQNYQIGIQCLIKDSEEERGLAIHSWYAMQLRMVLYRNAELQVGLGQLKVQTDYATEKLLRWGIRNQRYMNNDIEGKFVYVSTIDFWLETEMC